MSDPTGNALRAQDMTQGSAATERPWALHDQTIRGASGKVICRAPNHPENAYAWCLAGPLIVTAVNSHDQLLSDKAALEQENARLREALDRLVSSCEHVSPISMQASCDTVKDTRKTIEFMSAVDAARSALKGS